MEFYNDHDLGIFKNNIGEIMKKLDEYVLEHYPPTKDEKKAVQKTILDFAKEKKRKMYGGYGLHLAIVDKNISGSFYSNEELYSKDIDLYSPEPLKDLVELCKTLKRKGFKNVYAREAIHKETYTLEVNKLAYCDFSYVPRNVYNRIPFLQVDGMYVAHPYFLEIDYLKMFIDPILSHYRWDKSFNRFYSLQKYYPIRSSKQELKLPKKINSEVYDQLLTFAKNNKTISVSGFHAYNLYAEIGKTQSSFIHALDLPYFEFTSIDYEDDVKRIIKLLQDTEKGKLEIVEKYPFFTFTGFSSDLYLDGKLVCRIYRNLNNFCFAFVHHDSGVQIGTFHFNLRMCLINAIYARVNEEKETEQMFYSMASHLIQMRNNYLDKNNKNFLSDTIFKDFITQCMGETKDEKIKKSEEFKQERNHQAFKYDPDTKKEINFSDWVFMNSSGNPINNSRNFKIKIEPDIHIVKNQEEKQNEAPEEDSDEEDKSDE